MAIIEVDHLTKEYRLGALHSFKQTLLNAAARFTGKSVAERPRFKALDDVSFKVEQGEVVGIIGHNGAGKSTLLKMLAGIAKPTTGSVRVDGRIAPLIEVGAGFVPDFTGRENVYLNGSILGLSKKEIDRKFDEIVDFAEMEQFIDTPVKRYSSGMQVKLAFAVATSIEAEILIVDEVLAVGDLAFQRKCFDRMEDLIRRQGRTVLLVSHNIRQVERLCSRAILMSHGCTLQDGEPKTVCNAFYDTSDQHIYETKKRAASQGNIQPNGIVELEELKVLDHRGNVVESIEYQEDIEFQATYRVAQELPNPIFGLGVHTTDFLYLATSQSVESLPHGDLAAGMYTVCYKIKRFPFLPGIYSLRLGVALGDSFQAVFYAENVKQIHVVSRDVNRALVSQPGEGFIAMEGEWVLRREDSAESASACSGM